MTSYYNENDKHTAAWLRELIRAGLITSGDVDDRSIKDVSPKDLAGYTQCHFFAGIGGWAYALELAGWPEEREVWTGSCPCQPFSVAGKQEGTADARHLWPEWLRLIRECRPVAIFGEQVATAVRHVWLDLVSADLESLGYAVGAAVMGAHSVGAPHIRQRLYFVADAHDRCEGLESGSSERVCARRAKYDAQFGFRRRGKNGELAYPDGRNADAEGLQRGGEHGQQQEDGGAGPGVLADGDVGHSERAGLQEQRRDAGVSRRQVEPPEGQGAERTGASTSARSVNGFWSDAIWLPCIDGKARAVEPGTFPVAHGIPGRVGRLRGYGNAIVPQVAQTFIEAYLKCRT